MLVQVKYWKKQFKDMSMLGQSSIEYLTTYGWMVLAVSIAGAALYPTVDMGCNIQIDGNTRTADIKVEQAGVTSDGRFEVVLDSGSRQEIIVESLEMKGSSDELKVVQPQKISPGGEIVYPVGQVERTSSCQEYTINVKFDKGPLKNQNIQLGLEGSLNLVETFTSLLEITGDSIEVIEVKASIQPTEETICIGSQCSETEGPLNEENQYVNYSGDEMTGTLETNNIDSKCIGKNCSTTQLDETGYVNTEDAQVGGTLNVTEIMPVSDDNPVLDIR